MTCVSKPAPQKTKIAQKLSAVGCRTVLTELMFVQARQSPQRILDVFARVLTQHGRKSASQNRHGFKFCQPLSAARSTKADRYRKMLLDYSVKHAAQLDRLENRLAENKLRVEELKAENRAKMQRTVNKKKFGKYR